LRAARTRPQNYRDVSPLYAKITLAVRRRTTTYCKPIIGKNIPREQSRLRDERHKAALARILRRRGIDPVTMEPQDKLLRMLKQLDKAGIVPAESWSVAAP